VQHKITVCRHRFEDRREQTIKVRKKNKLLNLYSLVVLISLETEAKINKYSFVLSVSFIELHNFLEKWSTSQFVSQLHEW